MALPQPSSMNEFFRPNRIYAVIGASSQPQKFGYKVFKWYKDHGINAIPINIKGDTVLGVNSLKSVTDLTVPQKDDLALSVITPIPATNDLIQTLSINSLPVKAIWLQPGTYSPQTLELAKAKLKSVAIITDCILVNGEHYLNQSRM